MRFVLAVWEVVAGLIVEDGSIAIGAIAALVAVGLETHLAGMDESLRDLGGPLLFLLILVLIVVNLYGAGRVAARKRAP